MDRKQELYKQAVGLLKYIEIAIDNDDHYKIITIAYSSKLK